MKLPSKPIVTSAAEYRECSRRLALQSKIKSIQNEADKAYFVFNLKSSPQRNAMENSLIFCLLLLPKIYASVSNFNILKASFLPKVFLFEISII